jgi:aminoglycoside phosphotransferase (APT) family kinase protein
MYTPREVLAHSSRLGPQADTVVSGVDLTQQQGTVAELAAICQAWGAAVACLHTMSTRHPAAALAPRPRVLNPWHLMPSVRDAAPGSGYAAVLEVYEASPDLRAAASEVDERWTERHWIHGNLSAFNVIVEQRPALQVSFVNLEYAGLGDPAWDLASAVDTITWLSPRWRVLPQMLVDYFLQDTVGPAARLALSRHAGGTGAG